MALSVRLELVGAYFLPHRDGLFEGSRDDSLDGPYRITLVLGLEQAVAGFPRYHMYAVGADLRDSARGVVRANSAVDKAPLLRELRLGIEELKVLCRLA